MDKWGATKKRKVENKALTNSTCRPRALSMSTGANSPEATTRLSAQRPPPAISGLHQLEVFGPGLSTLSPPTFSVSVCLCSVCFSRVVAIRTTLNQGDHDANGRTCYFPRWSCPWFPTWIDHALANKILTYSALETSDLDHLKNQIVSCNALSNNTSSASRLGSEGIDWAGMFSRI